MNYNHLYKLLGGPTQDPRVFGNKALAFVQNIPYEKKAFVKDRYRRPLSLIGRIKEIVTQNRVVFIADEIRLSQICPLVLYTLKGMLLGLWRWSPKKEIRWSRKNETRYVAVEPVGPKVSRIGKVGPKVEGSLAVKRYRIRTLD